MTRGHTLFTRHPDNPLLTADDWPVPVNAVFNPGACRVDDETVLVCRVEDTRGMSHLWAARSVDGISGWRVDPEPFLSPRFGESSQEWGLEDARVVFVSELERFVLTCTAYGPPGPAVVLATTDMRTVERLEIVMPPEDKNASLFPRRIGNEWVLLHRPVTVHAGGNADIWLSRSADLDAWRRPEIVLRRRQGAWWDSMRIGAGPPPIETAEGWLVIYHGVRETVAGAIYRAGMALLDLDDPTRVLHRTPDFVLAPAAPYERIGDVPNVVFPTGAVHDVEAGRLHLYYGAADTVIAEASADFDAVVDHLLGCPAD